MQIIVKSKHCFMKRYRSLRVSTCVCMIWCVLNHVIPTARQSVSGTGCFWMKFICHNKRSLERLEKSFVPDVKFHYKIVKSVLFGLIKTAYPQDTHTYPTHTSLAYLYLALLHVMFSDLLYSTPLHCYFIYKMMIRPR